MWSRRGTLAVAFVLLAVTLAACKPGDPARSTGAYPIDIFQEMHYNQTYKAGEPPRFLPPEGSIPISGGALPAPAVRSDEARALAAAYPARAVERGALLYRQNCSMCHGLTADGHGPVGDKLFEYSGVQPPSFDSKRVGDLAPGEAYASIALGFGFMPPFQNLLNEEDRWALVALIEAETGERTRELQAIDGVDELERTLRLLELREASG